MTANSAPEMFSHQTLCRYVSYSESIVVPTLANGSCLYHIPSIRHQKRRTSEIYIVHSPTIALGKV
jgi:hypothetical protein